MTDQVWLADGEAVPRGHGQSCGGQSTYALILDSLIGCGLQMEKRSYEGMGTCTPSGSGQPPAISAHTGTSEQSIADMPGQQGSVQGLDRRALRMGLASGGSPSPARQPPVER